MKTTDARASSFNEDEFRDSIRFAMNMGIPENESDRPTFKWTVQKEYAIADPAGSPYSWTSTPTQTTTHADVQIPVAVTYTPKRQGDDGSPFGNTVVSRAVLTILDEDYANIIGADQVVLTGDTYNIMNVAPADGLFGVTVYEVYCESVDES